MLIQRFAEYVMRGRKEATLMAFFWTLVPLMGWVGLVVVGLVTLRKGILEGFFVLLWTALPAVVLIFLGYSSPLVFGVLAGNLVTFLLAITLRETNSWHVVLEVGCVIGILEVLAVHAFMGDVYGYWFNTINTYYLNTIKDGVDLQIGKLELKNIISTMALIATGMQVVVILLMNLLNLGLSRWLQAMLYNPGGLVKELNQIKLNLADNLLLVIVLVGVICGIKIAWDILPLVMFMFLLAGISLIHAIIATTKAIWLWLLGFYVLLALTFPYAPLLVIIMATADSWVDFRKYLNFKEV